MTKALVICNIPSKGNNDSIISLRVVLPSLTLSVRIDRSGFIRKPTVTKYGYTAVSYGDVVQAYKNLHWDIVREIEL